MKGSPLSIEGSGWWIKVKNSSSLNFGTEHLGYGFYIDLWRKMFWYIFKETVTVKQWTDIICSKKTSNTKFWRTMKEKKRTKKIAPFRISYHELVFFCPLVTFPHDWKRLQKLFCHSDSKRHPHPPNHIVQIRKM